MNQAEIDAARITWGCAFWVGGAWPWRMTHRAL